MQKTQYTIRLRPLIKLKLEKNVEELRYKNLNDYITDILEKHILKKEDENKTLEKIKSIDTNIDNINSVLEKLIDIVAK